MENERQEELKKLLISPEFKEEPYEGLHMQELIILRNSAETMKNKEGLDEKLVPFFTAKSEFFLHLIMRKVPKLETLYGVFSRATNLPYVVCDDDTLNDQAWLFSEEGFAQRVVLKQKEENVELFIVKMETSQFLQFFTSLYAMGVNELVMDKGMNSVAFEIGKLVKKPEYDGLPVEKRPVMNPELVLTAAYYAQGRTLPVEKQNKEQLTELEEEMIANLKRGKMIVPVIWPEGIEKPQVKDLRIPFLKLPNGDSYQPICCDQTEFMRFNRENKLRSLVVTGDKLKQMLVPNCKGIMLNPVTLRMAIPKEKL